jgi:hypothetical protein
MYCILCHEDVNLTYSQLCGLHLSSEFQNITQMSAHEICVLNVKNVFSMFSKSVVKWFQVCSLVRRGPRPKNDSLKTLV